MVVSVSLVLLLGALDVPDGPATPPPAWATLDALEESIRQAVATVHLRGRYVSLQVLLQWDDEGNGRQAALNLFDASTVRSAKAL